VLIGSFFLYGCGKAEPTMIPIVALDAESTTEEGQTLKEQGKLEGTAKESLESLEDSLIYVYISGAVEKTGVYEVEPDSRLYQVIEIAGGFLENASVDSVNQARKVIDGEQIRIPTVEEILSGEIVIEESSINGEVGSSSNSLVNINTATKDQLCTIAGVGETRAEGIIAYREKHGEFKEIEDIMKIDGIKEGLFSKMQGEITVK